MCVWGSGDTLFLLHAQILCSEKKEVRALAALGVIYVVGTMWLEDCDHEKKEVPVLRRHIAYNLLLPKGLITILCNLSVGLYIKIMATDFPLYLLNISIMGLRWFWVIIL